MARIFCVSCMLPLYTFINQLVKSNMTKQSELVNYSWLEYCHQTVVFLFVRSLDSIDSCWFSFSPNKKTNDKKWRGDGELEIEQEIVIHNKEYSNGRIKLIHIFGREFEKKTAHLEVYMCSNLPTIEHSQPHSLCVTLFATIRWYWILNFGQTEMNSRTTIDNFRYELDFDIVITQTTPNKNTPKWIVACVSMENENSLAFNSK